MDNQLSDSDFVSRVKALTKTIDYLIDCLVGAKEPFPYRAAILNKIPLLEYYNNDFKEAIKKITQVDAGFEQTKSEDGFSIIRYIKNTVELPWPYFFYQNESDAYVYMQDLPLTKEEEDVGYIGKAIYRKIS